MVRSRSLGSSTPRLVSKKVYTCCSASARGSRRMESTLSTALPPPSDALAPAPPPSPLVAQAASRSAPLLSLRGSSHVRAIGRSPALSVKAGPSKRTNGELGADPHLEPVSEADCAGLAQAVELAVEPADEWAREKETEQPVLCDSNGAS
mmetsp:Transcript_8286/g.27363  ORF Transcript_8286/g.27363 Transcript_8286/m.27363 type:complete len:150 (+) Transcript_8286:467-916(+)